MKTDSPVASLLQQAILDSASVAIIATVPPVIPGLPAALAPPAIPVAPW